MVTHASCLSSPAHCEGNTSSITAYYNNLMSEKHKINSKSWSTVFFCFVVVEIIVG